MIVCGKNVAREVINSNYNIKNIYLNENFNNGEILKLIEKNHIKPVYKSMHDMDKN